ncbi:hypothetical protein QYE76_007918 [Lolium multiflorum]|uniref:CCHC-type domain-containing protein n=1 Tax=Lolium multiflorum TaxID=4521 RepID=A0AAD8VDW1_LOLMU|nr:hypothetical protein QYE76_007918 [Lolium multiflorum]
MARRGTRAGRSRCSSASAPSASPTCSSKTRRPATTQQISGRTTMPSAVATSSTRSRTVCSRTTSATPAREVWDAVARTYDVDISLLVARRRFNDFQFDEGALLLEQIAHAEALAAAAYSFSDAFVAYWLARKVPEDLAIVLRACPGPYSDLRTSFVWRAARIQEAHRLRREAEQQGKAARAVEVKRQCWTCGKSGHIARNCTAYLEFFLDHHILDLVTSQVLDQVSITLRR